MAEKYVYRAVPIDSHQIPSNRHALDLAISSSWEIRGNAVADQEEIQARHGIPMKIQRRRVSEWEDDPRKESQ